MERERAWCAPPDGKTGLRALMPCNVVSWEKRPVWLIKGVPTGYSQYAYSKRLMYIDKDFHSMYELLPSMFDQGGVLWRVVAGNIFNYTKKPYEGYPTKPLPGAKYNYEDEWAIHAARNANRLADRPLEPMGCPLRLCQTNGLDQRVVL